MLKLIVDYAHRKKYGDTWRYDDKVLKRYVVRLRIKSNNTGNLLNVKPVRRVEAFTAREALSKASLDYKRNAGRVVGGQAIPIFQLNYKSR